MIDKILKFGGTSVGNPERMKHVANLVQDGERNLVVLSAVSGTTNQLENITHLLKEGKKDDAKQMMESLKTSYADFVNELFLKEEFRAEGKFLLDTRFSSVEAFFREDFSVFQEKTILAQGELISTGLFQLYMEENAIPSVLISALDYMRTDKDGEPDLYYIEKTLSEMVNNYPENVLFITQGYICRNAFGEIDNLKRGGSDYTASLVGVALNVKEIQIWTDIDGMHNNDPRYVDKTHPIKELSFEEAAELAYFGAKILHPASVFPAQKRNIPVRLKNTMEPEAYGTLISQKSSDARVKAVAAKDGITAIKVKSGRMLNAYGFLVKVFEVFERYQTPIDTITTSEVAISLTIDNTRYLSEIKKELQKYGHVEVDNDLSIICVVGDFVAGNSGYGVKIFESLKNVPIRMISYGGSKNNISFLVKTEVKKESLQSLNDGLFSELFSKIEQDV